MPRVLVIYDSWTGHTKKAAELIAEGAGKVAGVEVEVKRVNDVSADDIKPVDMVAIGCPTHVLTASWKMKRFLGRREISDSLRGKRGAAFTSCLVIPRATSWLKGKMSKLDTEIIDAIAVHSTPKGNEAEACRSLGERVAESAKSKPIET